ncbi:unnamed protein product [Phytophthora lilii]|uniref:Unnamed protein product n=1 Tax=Phytophthora lilii TaxID=2077276 RepID=A0A9W6TF21_9STRA|nr:unnamed protein product [Phytophthora lilii]
MRVQKTSRIFQTTLSSSGSAECPDECPMDMDPVIDANGVEYFNECLMLMAQCTQSSLLAASDLADELKMFESQGLEGTITMTGSGSTEHPLIDIGLEELFGVKKSESENALKGDLLSKITHLKPAPMNSMKPSRSVE